MEEQKQYFLIKKMDMNTRQKLRYHASKGNVVITKTPNGLAVTQEAIDFVSQNHKTGKQITGFQISLNSTSRINALYYKVADMSTKNREYIGAHNDLPKYVAEDGYLYINIKDYIKPQLKVLARKIECKESEIMKYIYELLKSRYTQGKRKETIQKNKETRALERKLKKR